MSRMPNTNMAAARQKKAQAQAAAAAVEAAESYKQKTDNIDKVDPIEKFEPVLVSQTSYHSTTAPVSPPSSPAKKTKKKPKLLSESQIQRDDDYYMEKFAKKPFLDHVNAYSSTVDFARSRQKLMKESILQQHQQKMNRGRQIREVLDVPKHMPIQQIAFAPSVLSQAKRRAEMKKLLKKQKVVTPNSSCFKDDNDNE